MKKSFWKVFIVLLAASAIYSCKNEDDEKDNPYKYVNDWISESLNEVYYWNDKIPAKTDKTLAPKDYFESLLYRYDKQTAPDGDRFSWIQENYQDLLSSLSGVSSNEIGFDYVLYLKEANSDKVIGEVTYVKKGTPAQTAGIKRGMWFNKINDTEITTSNYTTLLSTTSSKIKLGTIQENYNSSSFSGFSTGNDYEFNTLSSYSDDPVYLDSVYTINNKKIGYLVYNFFSPDNGSDNQAYDLEMNNVFTKFKSAGITDLILDLRYNSGGYSTSGQRLASMIVPNLDVNNVYAYYEYNSILTAYYKEKYGAETMITRFTDGITSGNTVVAKISNVGNNLNRLYILTGQYTASASEQLINGLKPYMNVVLIGDTTYGKNVASTPIYVENDSKNKWGMEPIIAKFFNKNGQSDFTAGFAPDYRVDDTGIGIYQLGDIRENLLYTALSGINGSLSVQRRRIPCNRFSNNNRMIYNSLHRQRGLQIRGLRLPGLN